MRLTPTIITLASLLILCPALHAAAPAPKRAPVPNRAPAPVIALLDAWKESEAQRQRYILEYQITADGDNRFDYPGYTERSGKRKYFCGGEVRWDGSRILFSTIDWAESENASLAIPKDKPRRRTWAWDGNAHYFHTPGIGLTVTLGMGSCGAERSPPTAVSRGWFEQFNEPIDATLRRSPASKLQPDPELIDGSPCRVIESTGREGRHRIWIDTARGNVLVKADCHFAPGDIYNGKPLKKGYQIDMTMTDVKVERTADDIWYPTGFHTTYASVFPTGSMRSSVQCSYANIKLAPDALDEPNAFVPTVEEGLRVRIVPDRSDKRYSWQKGEIVDEEGVKVDLTQRGRGD